ncbi:hypothetical protein [Lysobacter sp. Root916]|uniref:hypothetical protein n=1 Tax=Lysobacter sp. Root916 TaxID=1736606 RepID=UPI0012FC9059|nr:hypothetical protein [Lysobacter sp. Root916]
MGQQVGSESYFRRLINAVGITWLTLAFYNLAMRAMGRLDLELVLIIVGIALLAALVAGAIAAAVIRRRPVALVVASQLIGMAIVAIAAAR